jgi:hypothetical protein
MILTITLIEVGIAHPTSLRQAAPRLHTLALTANLE